MIHPHTALVAVPEADGLGVVATRPIPAGTVVWVRDSLDRTLQSGTLEKLAPLELEALDRYSYVDRCGRRVLCWDHARFVNHACEPTCMSPGYEFEVAVRDIGVGEQLTDDYAALNLKPEWTCQCGSPRCRGLVGEATPELVEQWDAMLQAVWPHIATVPQPLWSLVTNRYTKLPTDPTQLGPRSLPLRSSWLHLAAG